MEQIRPKNYLIESILVTISCCLPLGIVGIVYASQVNSKFNYGDFQGAKTASREARRWMIWGLISGIIVALFYLIIFLTVGTVALFSEH